jgi:hypothetical protein
VKRAIVYGIGVAAFGLSALLACGQPPPARPTLRIVPVEVLAARYRDFDETEVTMAGVVIGGEEGTIMYVTPAGDREPAGIMWIVLSERLARHPDALEREFACVLASRGAVTAILRGRFSGRERRQFGHQMCCRFKLEVTKVLSVG